jgi:hypothetical protein
MMVYDCFNGDADGICALTQLRLHNPENSELITGVKRDINLLQRVTPQSGDVINVLDISLDKNRVDLERVLRKGASVFYCDHHYAGDIPSHPQLTSIINTSADACTSLLINKQLKGRYLEWAVVGTFGDNLKRAATGMAKALDISEKRLAQLENLGVYLNYNGYGASLEDLYFDPAVLFQRTSKYASAFDFMADDSETFATLENGYHEDMAKAGAAEPIFETSSAAVFHLPNQAWSRRVSGVFGNDLANQNPARAHAVVTDRADGDFLVSVRAPLEKKKGADEVCRQFPTGGGRAAAAGINQLDSQSLERFINVFSDYYSA